MQFRLGTHGAAFADGTITPGTADAFADFIESDRASGVTEIVLHSPGGSLNDAEAMARLIRDKGLATRVLADGCAVGHLARQMLGRTPQSVAVVRQCQTARGRRGCNCVWRC